ncbi:MAG: oligoendopeptidase, partial [Actinomycetes bacterium]
MDATSPALDDADLTAADVAWDLEPLLNGRTAEDLVGESEQLIDQIESYRGRIGDLDADGLATLMRLIADVQDLQGRAAYHAMLRMSENTLDPERGAAMMAVQERLTPLATRLVFVELEWAAVDESHVDALL